jgi:hypothetical protein
MAGAPQDFKIILCRGFQREFEIFNGDGSAHLTALLENLSISSQNPDCGIQLCDFQWWLLQVLCQEGSREEENDRTTYAVRRRKALTSPQKTNREHREVFPRT